MASSPVDTPSEFPSEAVKIGIGNFQDTVFHPENIFVVYIHGITGYFDIPSREVFSVKQRYPLGIREFICPRMTRPTSEPCKK
jgi:hypothetical protein